ncbi:hypothetical protein [Dethiobacter alkaliphilus]|nr:hypothetical protein [Dethiobacter alkaliphilus]MCW3488672.1 hypothetical protein [Dethiobacter alkaliphilus]
MFQLEQFSKSAEQYAQKLRDKENRCAGMKAAGIEVERKLFFYETWS